MITNILLGVVFASLFIVAIGYYIRSNKKDKNSTNHLVKGFLALVDGNLSQGISSFKEAALADTNNIDAFLILSELLSRRGNFHDADKILASLLIRSELTKKDRIKSLIAATENALKSGNLEKAFSFAKLAHKKDKNAKTLANFIKINEALENWDLAFKTRSELMKIDKNNAHKEILACYLLKQAQPDLYHQAIELDPNSPFPYLLLGDSHKRNNDLSSALKYWKELAHRFPSACEIVFGRIEAAYYELGEYGNTINFYRKLADNELGKIHANKALAEIYYKMGDWEKTLETLKNIPDNDIEAMILRAKIATDNPNLDVKDELDLLYKEIASKKRFICTNCGTNQATYDYHCPKCKQWNSISI